jgi:DNA invertase Pin-like site-specific DNA recombinase
MLDDLLDDLEDDLDESDLNAMRAALYGRISSNPEHDEKGVKRQIRKGRRLVESRGGTVVMERTDNDISASKGAPRPGYEEIMAAAEAGKITHIVVFQSSRWWRNRSERAEGIERLRKAGVSIVAIKGLDLDFSTASGRLMAGVLGEFDTAESEFKSERILEKVEELAAEGKIANGGPRPFGYTRVYAGEGPRRKIVRDEINEAEAEIIRECARRFLADEPAGAIVRDLNERGINTSTGARWSIQALKWMLRSGRIAGLRERRREIVGPAVWPAIIDLDAHQQLRALINRGRTGRSNPRKFYPTGFVFCTSPDCLRRNVKMKAFRTLAGVAKYRCPPKVNGGCGGRSIDLDAFLDLVDRYMQRRLSDPEVLRELAERENVRTVETGRLLARIDDDERRLALLRASLEDGEEDDLPEVVASVRAIRKRLREARDELAALAKATHLVGEDLPDLARRWPDLSLDRKRILLATFVERILVGPAVRGLGKFDPRRVEIVPRQTA